MSSRIHIFPNPLYRYGPLVLHLSGEAQSPLIIKILDTKDVCILERTVSCPEIEFNIRLQLPELPGGNYRLLLESSNLHGEQRLLIL